MAYVNGRRSGVDSRYRVPNYSVSPQSNQAAPTSSLTSGRGTTSPGADRQTVTGTSTAPRTSSGIGTRINPSTGTIPPPKTNTEASSNREVNTSGNIISGTGTPSRTAPNAGSDPRNNMAPGTGATPRTTPNTGNGTGSNMTPGSGVMPRTAPGTPPQNGNGAVPRTAPGTPPQIGNGAVPRTVPGTPPQVYEPYNPVPGSPYIMPSAPSDNIPMAPPVPGAMPEAPSTPPGTQPNIYYPPFQAVPNTYTPYTPEVSPFDTPAGVPMFPLYGYDNSTDMDRDVEYMKRLYPRTARAIQKEIDIECDKMEYDGSVMFDEYPDKEYLERLVDRIYERIGQNEEEPLVETSSVYLYPPRRRENYLRDVVSLLLLSEIFHRRRRYRSRNRWF